ncbi:MAG: 4-hydroxythreonine-4-phosphate dehydrogenase PdxA [Phycisphaerales bacterium]
MPGRLVIAITVGDPLGIGPEIAHKTAGDVGLKGRAKMRVYGERAAPESGVRGPTREGGEASFRWVEEAIADAKRPRGDARRVDAIVTGPISKEAWALAGHAWPGHTELLAERFASPKSGMLFVGPRLRVILATVHVPLVDVASVLTTARVLECIELGAQACGEMGVKQPRVGVAGLNPHAGEHGLLGKEDAGVIAPAVAQARANGLDVDGPVPGDVVFARAAKGEYGLVVAMYHDQGLIPVKLLDRERSVNTTVGLVWAGERIVRTSPAHGTAFDIAGKGVADATSMKAAVELAIELASMADGTSAPPDTRPT